MRNSAAFLLIIFTIVPYMLLSQVITRLPTDGKVVALTFDACETKTPSYFDLKILDFLLRENIPFTLFISGKFAERPVNALIIRGLSKLRFVEIENHSFSHPLHMEKLSEREVEREVLSAEKLLLALTGKRPSFFRFPGGNYNERSLRIVESLGYRIVQWSFESGDPDPKITPERLKKWVLKNTHPGSILIFHINGRGYSTAKALPEIVEELRKEGYRFVRLDLFIKPGSRNEK